MLAAFALCGANGVVADDTWEPLRKDGIHDPRGPAIKQLQEPAEALSQLPRDTTGNMVKWVEAIDKGIIKPRASLKPNAAPPQILDTDILLNQKGGMPMVLFPHKRHTQWLDCSNCHPALFNTTAGTTQLSMFQILHGEQCGVCHGAVSFPLTECFRCHSVLHPGQQRPAIPPAIPGPGKLQEVKP